MLMFRFGCFGVHVSVHQGNIHGLLWILAVVSPQNNIAQIWSGVVTHFLHWVWVFLWCSKLMQTRNSCSLHQKTTKAKRKSFSKWSICGALLESIETIRRSSIMQHDKSNAMHNRLNFTHFITTTTTKKKCFSFTILVLSFVQSGMHTFEVQWLWIPQWQWMTSS